MEQEADHALKPAQVVEPATALDDVQAVLSREADMMGIESCSVSVF
jgi:hypothetical protein